MPEWEQFTIGQLIDNGAILVHKDGNHGANYPRVDDFGNHGLPFLTAKSLSDWKVDIENAPRLSQEKANSFRFGFVEEGDVLLSHNATVGRVGIVPALDGRAVIGTSLTQFRLDRSKILPEFLAIYFSSRNFQNELSFVMAQTTRNQVPITAQRRLPVAVPDVSTQRSISEMIFSLIHKIDLNRGMNETLEAIALAIFKDWFIDFGPTRAKMERRDPYLANEIWSLFPNRFDDEGKPEGWDRKSVYDHADYVNGAAYKDMHFTADGSGWPVVKIAELKAGITGQTRFTATDLGDRYQIDNGELLFSWSGNPDTSIDTFIWQNGRAWLNQHIFAVRPNGAATKAHLYLLLRYLKPEFAEIARNKQTTGLGHVTMQDLRRLTMAYPSEPLRLTFEGQVAPLIQKLELNIAESRALAAVRDLLLPKLMSGEIRVKDAEAIVGKAT